MGGNDYHMQSDEFMINTRDELLHLRTYAPADGQDIKALVLFLHGWVKFCLPSQ